MASNPRPKATKPLKTVTLELTEPEARALAVILSRWPSRPLAVKTGHSRNTLRAWYLRIAWQIGRRMQSSGRQVSSEKRIPPSA